MSKVWKCCFAFARNELCRDLSESSDSRMLARELNLLGHTLEVAVWNDSEVKWSDYDLVLPLSVFDYPVHYREFINWLNILENENVKVLNDLYAIRWNMDKRYLFELEKQGVNIPDTTVFEKLASDFPSLNHLLNEKSWENAIIKPVIGADGLGVRLVNKHTDVTESQNHFENLLVGGDTFLQEYIPPMHTNGEIKCIFIRGDFSHAILQIPNEAGSMNNGFSKQRIRPSEEIICAAKHALEVAKKLIPFNEHFLYARVDLCEDKSRNRVILSELEILEPYLYLAKDKHAAKKLALGVVDYLNLASTKSI